MIQFTVGKNMLLPHDDAARAALAKRTVGEVVDVELLHDFDAIMNAKMFAAFEKLGKATGFTAEEMRCSLLVLTGRFKIVKTLENKRVMVVDSMSRRTMTQAARESLWRDIQATARADILPMIDPQAAADIRNIFEGRYVNA